jgi:ABC-type multidrug transport system fused ATPase/permease subunit
MPLSFIGDLPLGHDLVAAFFDHRHWWLHSVVHAVLVGGPIAFLLLAGALCLKGARSAIRSPVADIAPADPVTGSALDRGVFGYILARTWRMQAWLLAGAVATMPVLYVTLELPKVIINGAIASGHFPVAYWGVTLSQVDYLVVLCLLYLAAVLAGNGMKYAVNLGKGRVGEALLRRLRGTVLHTWRRRDRSDGCAPLIPVLVQELEVIGGFSADMLALPVLQGGTFLTILTFMLVQDPVLGAAAITLLPLQLAVIPRLQRRVNALGRARALEVRHLGQLMSAEQTGRPLFDLVPIHGCFRRIQAVRNELYRRKFLMKSVLNLIQHMTPFFFYTIGGYLVIEGRLTLGALIAVLAAYKDFTSPLRVLFGYSQRLEDVRVRYADLKLALSQRRGHGAGAGRDDQEVTTEHREIAGVRRGIVNAPPVGPLECPGRTGRSRSGDTHRSARARPPADRRTAAPGSHSSADASPG